MAVVEIRGGAELRRISLELRRMGGGELTRKLRKELRAAAAPLVPQVRASIMQIPTTGDKSSGLRRRMAKATRLELRTVGREAGVAIRVDGRKMPTGQGRLPAYMEGSRKRWRHPVYGNRNNWVGQQPHPYFYNVVRNLGPRSRVAVNRVLDEATREIS